MYLADMVPPTLVSFSMNVNTARISLTFSELTRSALLAVTGFTIQNTASSPTLSYTLTTGEIMAGTAATVSTLVIDQTNIDLDSIQKMINLTISAGTAYIAVVQGSVLDLDNNKLVGIATSSALAVIPGMFVPDTTNPLLLSSTPIMNSLTLNLTFDTQMLLTSIDVTALTIQST